LAVEIVKAYVDSLCGDSTVFQDELLKNHKEIKDFLEQFVCGNEEFHKLIDESLEEIRLIAEDKRVKKIKVVSADSFPGYYVRGYDETGKEIYTHIFRVDAAVPAKLLDIELITAVESDFIEDLDGFLETYGFKHDENEYVR
jgi:hypothetical protein